MVYELFEGKKDLRTVKDKKNVLIFQNIRRKLKFERDIDLIAFCGSIGLYKTKVKKSNKKDNNFQLIKLTSLLSFERAHLFDYIILTFLNVEVNRMHEFESYFYTGFKILKDWWNDNDQNMNNTLDRFSSIIDDLINNNESSLE